MTEFKKIQDVSKALGEAQEAESDMREASREADHFLNKRDGQWEPSVLDNMTGRPKYQFDKCNPVVDQIMDDIEQSDFEVSVVPAGGQATKDVALTFDGMIRNLDALSGAEFIYSYAAREMVSMGLSGWRMVQAYANQDTFEQDLLIKPISNFVDRVWFDPNSELQCRSDAGYGFLLHSLTKDVYKKKFPKGSGSSVGDDRTFQAYSYKKDEIIIGELYFSRPHKRTLVLMSNGAVYEEDEKFKELLPVLEQAGITVQKTRTRESNKFYTQFFDGNDFLNDPKETVFDTIPIVPCYGNFKISENKVIYFGAIEKLMDGQRVYNYAKSRQVEEGALAPRRKFWMTKQQAEGNLEQIRTLNINADPVQFYTYVDGQPPPFETGGAVVNPSLQTTADDASGDMNASAGLFSSNMGDNPGLQSGIAIERQQQRGFGGNYKYLKSVLIAINRTADLYVRAIPKVYDTRRQQRILGQDGTVEMVTLNDKVMNPLTGQVEELNNLAVGTYAVNTTIAPRFKNRQQETVKTITDIAAVDESIIQLGADILLRNITAPGIKELAERKRAQMVQAGLIPDNQLTQEEQLQRLIQMQQQGQNLTPEQQAAMSIAQAEQQRVQAETERAQANTADIISKAQDREIKLALEQQKLDQQALKDQMNFSLKIEELSAKIENQNQQMLAKIEQQRIDSQTVLDQQLKLQADTLNAIKQAMGVETIVGNNNIEAYGRQAQRLTDTQIINQ